MTTFERVSRREVFPEEPEGDEVVRGLLEEIEEDEQLGAALGVDLSPPSPQSSPVSTSCSLEGWLLRAEEVQRYLAAQRRAESAARRR